MVLYATKRLPSDPSTTAPDGSEVRVLLSLGGGSMAHFRLGQGQVSSAVAHRTVDELWYVVAGAGHLWRSQTGAESVDALMPGVCVTIPQGTHFQFRAAPDESLEIVAVTMPPWPGNDEAYLVPGAWSPSSGAADE